VEINPTLPITPTTPTNNCKGTACNIGEFCQMNADGTTYGCHTCGASGTIDYDNEQLYAPPSQNRSSLTWTNDYDRQESSGFLLTPKETTCVWTAQCANGYYLTLNTNYTTACSPCSELGPGYSNESDTDFYTTKYITYFNEPNTVYVSYTDSATDETNTYKYTDAPDYAHNCKNICAYQSNQIVNATNDGCVPCGANSTKYSNVHCTCNDNYIYVSDGEIQPYNDTNDCRERNKIIYMCDTDAVPGCTTTLEPTYIDETKDYTIESYYEQKSYFQNVSDGYIFLGWLVYYNDGPEYQPANEGQDLYIRISELKSALLANKDIYIIPQYTPKEFTINYFLCLDSDCATKKQCGASQTVEYSNNGYNLPHPNKQCNNTDGKILGNTWQFNTQEITSGTNFFGIPRILESDNKSTFELTVVPQPCPAGSYCPNGEEKLCPAGSTSDEGKSDVSGCYLTTQTQICQSDDNNKCFTVTTDNKVTGYQKTNTAQ